MKKFVFYKQLNAMDCGPTCLRMIARYHGKHFNADTLRKLSGFGKAGTSMLGLSDSAEKIGFRTRGVKITLQQLQNIELPCVLHWKRNHFVVLKTINEKNAVVADPGRGIMRFKIHEFKDYWLSTKNEDDIDLGVVLLLEPIPRFFEQPNEKEPKLNWHLVAQYLKPAKYQIGQVFIALMITSFLQLIFPFLTQGIVDVGINGQNINYIVVVLVAQLMLTFSQTIVNFIRSRILLRVSNVLNIQILSDFWIKLTKLPLSYFDTHHTGDILQRLRDQKEIEAFLTSTALSTLFSIINFFIYAIVLIFYSATLFFVFCAGSILYFLWIRLFLRLRRSNNFQNFFLSSKENTATLQMIEGMQEIRLNNAEKQKRWEWENIQVNILKLTFKNLNYNQLQSAGGTFIIQTQGVIISFLVAKFVIDGHLTFGSMLAIQYIIGQLTSPVQEWIGFVQNFQDAKISMERLNEVHQLADEEKSEQMYVEELHDNRNIVFHNLSFTYPGSGNEPVLKNISLKIPRYKVTAIVGASGSGKTTLLKLLLKIYHEYSGEIRLSAANHGDGAHEGIKFSLISPRYWRSLCGAVLQDGYIFNDSIARNVAVGDENINYDNLIYSCKIANIHSHIESLPNGYHTRLGAAGTALSQGQKQRILIARAVYKNPEYLFFDEATNALDANNERIIVENLEHIFKRRTVVIVAHRLSTVKNADKIIVLEHGKIIEEGTHATLTAGRGKYYELVKNQLELGNS
jgi:ATP-binding cassette, subfamily B, bacterial